MRQPPDPRATPASDGRSGAFVVERGQKDDGREILYYTWPDEPHDLGGPDDPVEVPTDDPPGTQTGV